MGRLAIPEAMADEGFEEEEEEEEAKFVGAQIGL